MKKKLFRVAVLVGSVIVSPFYVLWRALHGKKTKIKYNSIVDGFTNYKFPDDRTERVAKYRASICAKCPFAEYSKAIKTVSFGERIKEVKGMYCGACGCSLSAKVRSMNDWCPKYKW